jgi:hypothetical protein
MTPDEITKILKIIILQKDADTTDVTLDPPIIVSEVSGDDATPTFTITTKTENFSTTLPNITDVGEIDYWSWRWNERLIGNSPQRELAYDIICTTLKNYFQHFSRTFVRIKQEGVFQKKPCVYSGVISVIDQELNNFPLTKHTISINDEVLTKRINQLNKNLRMLDLEKNSADILPELYKNYSIDKPVGLTLKWKYALGYHYRNEFVRIVPIDIDSRNRRSVLTDSATIKPASAQSVFKSIDEQLDTRLYGGYKLGKFTSLPPGWLVPRSTTDNQDKEIKKIDLNQPEVDAAQVVTA